MPTIRVVRKGTSTKTKHRLSSQISLTHAGRIPSSRSIRHPNPPGVAQMVPGLCGAVRPPPRNTRKIFHAGRPDDRCTTSRVRESNKQSATGRDDAVRLGLARPFSMSRFVCRLGSRYAREEGKRQKTPPKGTRQDMPKGTSGSQRQNRWESRRDRDSFSRWMCVSAGCKVQKFPAGDCQCTADCSFKFWYWAWALLLLQGGQYVLDLTGVTMAVNWRASYQCATLQ